jgi:DHA1 family bicyclomycin/chloramphenicol resistance-like MFS transporter
LASAAISIDLILPAFGRIRADLGLAPDSAATAGLVTAFFLGMAVGPIPFGLLADRFGRRWVLLSTCMLFVGGALAAATVPSLHWMLWARFAWGLGAAGLRPSATGSSALTWRAKWPSPWRFSSSFRSSPRRLELR